MLARLLTCALMLLAVAIQYSDRIAGHTVVQSGTEPDTVIFSGTRDEFVIDTRIIAAGIKGYGGNTPLRITVSNGKIHKIDALWSGVCFEWMNYEPFSAFIFTKASRIVISIALSFGALSFLMNRPYCRFVCPTDNLFRITQKK